MCSQYRVIAGDKVTDCESVAELAAALGVPPAEVSDDPEDCCLCNAKRVQLGARRANDKEGWPFPEYIIVRSNVKTTCTA